MVLAWVENMMQREVVSLSLAIVLISIRTDRAFAVHKVLADDCTGGISLVYQVHYYYPRPIQDGLRGFETQLAGTPEIVASYSLGMQYFCACGQRSVVLLSSCEKCFPRNILVRREGAGFLDFMGNHWDLDATVGYLSRKEGMVHQIHNRACQNGWADK